MDLSVFHANELPYALRALRDVMSTSGELSPRQRRFLEVIAELHAQPTEVAALEQLDAEAITSAIQSPHARKRAVQLALIAAMVEEGGVTDDAARAVRGLARALDVDEAGLRVIHDVAANHRLLTRVDMLRRMAGGVGGKIYEEEGLAGIGRVARQVAGHEDPELAWRYKSLGLLPEGTFGRSYWEHCTRRRFAFPGEKGGLPERMVFHDFGHVLSGYDTDAPGEIQQGAFQAGFVRDDGFTFLLFAVIHFHLGIGLTPIAKAETGLFDVEKVMRAAARGAACNVDLSDHWDPFAVASLPLEQVRADYGIPPLA